MKKILFTLSLITALTAFGAGGSKVYICVSKSSVAYHATSDCAGLRNCTHEIKAVTLTEAQNSGRRACKKCY